MRRPDPHLEFEELAVGYALHSLEPQDEVRFTEHLASCATCEQSLREHADTLAQLAHAAPSVEPPASILEGIRAGVAADRRDDLKVEKAPDTPVTPSSAVPEVPPLAASAPGPSSEPDDLERVRRRRNPVSVRRSHLLVSAAAVAALLLGLGGWNAALQRDRDDQEALTGRLAATVQALERDSTRTVPMTAPNGEVLAVAVVQGDQMSLVVDGLAPNDRDDSTYVLWGQSRFGDVRAVSTFDVPHEGLDVLHGMVLEQGVGEVTTLMVTREQGRTAPAMTTQPVLISGSV